jgi:phosphatidylglycerol lysyltransferase
METSDALAEPPSPRERALSLLKRFGWNATSFQILEPGFRYWFDGDDACVAYADTGGAWVAAGAPIAEEGRIGDVARRFAEAAREARRRACFFAVERRFLDATGMRAILVGEQPSWDPRAWGATLRGARGLREQLRRARAKGVTVRELAPGDVADEASAARGEIDALVDRWLSHRRMPPMTFLVDLHPFSFTTERRYFVAAQPSGVVGFLAAVPVYARGGWFFEDLLRDPHAPNGTAELLVHHALSAIAEAGSGYATLGLAPLAGPVAPWLRAARRLGRALYNFEGVRAFKAKLRPAGWAPIYLAVPDRGSRAAALYDTLAAFAGGSLIGFGLRTIAHVGHMARARLAPGEPAPRLPPAK